MRKITIAVVIVILLIIENVIVWFLSDFYAQSRAYEKILEANKGLTQACKTLEISDTLFAVLKTLDKFSASIETLNDGRLYLTYGDEWFENPGVGLLFDKDLKLTHKTCNSDWEPEIPNFTN